MKPGDLVRLNNDIYGTELRHYNEGSIGIIVGPAQDPVIRGKDCFLVHINGVLEEISDHWMDEVKDD